MSDAEKTASQRPPPIVGRSLPLIHNGGVVVWHHVLTDSEEHSLAWRSRSRRCCGLAAATLRGRGSLSLPRRRSTPVTRTRRRATPKASFMVGSTGSRWTSGTHGSTSAPRLRRAPWLRDAKSVPQRRYHPDRAPFQRS